MANYILPGFDEPGKCARLMNKWNQYEFAFQNNIPMAKTWLVSTDKLDLPTDITFPCIIKPAVSAFGSKADISICDTPDFLYQRVDELKHSGYETMLIQKFLQKRYEICAYGAVAKNSNLTVGGIVKKEREFPRRGGGSLTYARFIETPEITQLVNKILDLLCKDGYHGQYDIEFFACEDGIYLNEINFRHSGNGYALVKNGVLAPYIWCLDVEGLTVPVQLKKTVKAGKTHMDEIPDFVHRKEYKLSFIKWLGCFASASARSKMDIRDLSGTMVYYNEVLGRGFKKLFTRKKRK